MLSQQQVDDLLNQEKYDEIIDSGINKKQQSRLNNNTVFPQLLNKPLTKKQYGRILAGWNLNATQLNTLVQKARTAHGNFSMKEMIPTNESVPETIGKVIGYGGVGILGGLGLSLLVLAAVEGGRGIAQIWRQIFKGDKNKPSIKEFKQTVDTMKKDPEVRKTISRIERLHSRYENRLESVINAIDAVTDVSNKEAYNEAIEVYKELPMNMQNDKDVQMVIAAQLVKKTGEPPTRAKHASTSTTSFLVLREMIGLQMTKAISDEITQQVNRSLEDN